MIHDDICGIGRGLVYSRVSAIAKIGARPSAKRQDVGIRLQEVGSVILRASDREPPVGRMHGYALKLSSDKSSIVQARPVRAGIG